MSTSQNNDSISLGRGSPKTNAVGIIGTGPIAFGYAAFLAANGFGSEIWSPSDRYGHEIPITASGAVQMECKPALAKTAKGMVENCSVVIIAVPAYGHKDVIDQISPHLRDDQAVIISSHVPFGGQYLQSKLASRRIVPLIIALSTTVLSGRKTDETHVNINSVRDQVDMATLPKSRSEQGLKLCQELFGDRFVLRDDMLAIALSNLNPQNHLGIALCNLTRMEKGESWVQAENITPAVGRLLEKLDAERLAIATALNLKVRNIYEHFSRSFHVKSASVAQMSAEMVANGHQGKGPTSLETRYILEDVPYGLVPVVWLGRQVGVPAVLHEAGITLFNAMYDRDFFKENQLMNEMMAAEKTDSALLKRLGG